MPTGVRRGTRADSVSVNGVVQSLAAQMGSLLSDRISPGPQRRHGEWSARTVAATASRLEPRLPSAPRPSVCGARGQLSPRPAVGACGRRSVHRRRAYARGATHRFLPAMSGGHGLKPRLRFRPGPRSGTLSTGLGRVAELDPFTSRLLHASRHERPEVPSRVRPWPCPAVGARSARLEQGVARPVPFSPRPGPEA